MDEFREAALALLAALAIAPLAVRERCTFGKLTSHLLLDGMGDRERASRENNGMLRLLTGACVLSSQNSARVSAMLRAFE